MRRQKQKHKLLVLSFEGILKSRCFYYPSNAFSLQTRFFWLYINMVVSFHCFFPFGHFLFCVLEKKKTFFFLIFDGFSLKGCLVLQVFRVLLSEKQYMF